MPKAYLLLGGNLGERLTFVANAREGIKAQVGDIVQSSKVYETAAWGNTEQPAYLNQVLEVQTELPPELLLQKVNALEQELGRVRLEHWGARVIDIDILFYEELVLQSQRLTVPHPQLHLRRFTLLPLADIAPNLMHPLLQKTVRELLAICPDVLEVREYKGS